MSISSELREALSSLEAALEKKTENVEKSLNTVLEIISKNGNLWKSFKKWSKQQHISKDLLKRSKITQVAEAILKSDVLKSKISSLKDTLLQTEKLHAGKLTPSSTVSVTKEKAVPIFRSLQQFDIDFLKEAFTKNHRKLEKVIQLIESCQSLILLASAETKKFLEDLQIRLQVWALQYLTRGAKISVLEQKGPIHLAFLEYHKDNMHDYYRQGGGTLVQLLLNFLKEKYQLPQDKNYVFEVIKPETFSIIIQAACKNLNISYVLQDLMPDHIPESSNGHFFDISKMLKKCFAMEKKSEEFQKLRVKCCELAKKSKMAVLFGGEIVIEEQRYYILFPCPAVDEFAYCFRGLRASLGAVPEMTHIRYQLIREGFQLQKALEYSPLESSEQKTLKLEGNYEGIKSAWDEINKTLTSQTPNILIVQTYFFVFYQLLTTIQQTMEREGHLKELTHLGPLIHAIENIDKRMKNIAEISSSSSIPPESRFQEIMQEVYLATEELTFILCFTNLAAQDGSFPTLQKAIQDLEPESEYKQSFVCTSGMSAFLHVLEGLKKMYTSAMQIAFLESSYYELTGTTDFGGYLQSFAQYESYISEDLFELKSSPDLICMDIYPNNVTLPKVSVPPILDVIAKHVQNKNASRPLTVILDATSALFWSEPIPLVLKQFSKEIQEGRLNFVVVASLAKFAMCGLDKYTGGAIQVYNNGSYPLFNKHLTKQTQQDALSLEAEKFFFLFMQKKAGVLQRYIQNINKNTEYVYEGLASLQNWDSFIKLGEKGEGIPMLGFSFKNIVNGLFGECKTFEEDQLRQHLEENLTYFMCYFLAAKALQKGLPVSVRMSFGFLSTNFTACATALRMTIGLEDKPILDKYIDMLINEDKIFGGFSSLKDSGLKKIKYLLDKRGVSLRSWIENHKVELIHFAKDKSFDQVMIFIYDQVDPEKMIEAALQDLKGEDLKWALRHKDNLKHFAKNYCTDTKAMCKFVNEKLVPCRLKLEEISEGILHKQWLWDHVLEWIDFVMESPLEKLETYINNTYLAISWLGMVNSLLNDEIYLGAKASTFKTSLEDLKKIFFEYARNHSWNELKIYAEKIVNLEALLLKAEKLEEKERSSLRDELTDYVQYHTVQELHDYIAGEENYKFLLPLPAIIHFKDSEVPVGKKRPLENPEKG